MKAERTGASGKLEGKCAVITGGSRGIGAAIAQAFVEEGAAVALVHRGDVGNAGTTLAGLRARNLRCLAINCDVVDPAQVERSVERISRELADADILVNCAGIGRAAALEETTLELWDDVMSVNLTGTFLMSRACYPGMRRKGWGRIINVSSQMAFSGGVAATAYCASKAGVIGFTRALAVEAAPHGVLVNCIAPGATMTEMLQACGEAGMQRILGKIPLGRFGRPEEIASTALLLASEGGSFYVGQTLSPNGGDVLL